MNNSLAYTLFFIGGALVGGCGVFLVLSDSSTSTVKETTVTTATSASKLAQAKSGRIGVSNQTAGAVVMIDSIDVPPPGVWVAVREVVGTELGNVLGAARARSATTSLAVSLLRETVPQREYAVVLYRDDGDDLFTLSGDSVYVDFETGASVIASFSTTP